MPVQIWLESMRGKVYHLEHEGQKDVVLALALLEGGEVCGEQGVRVHPRHLHVPLVQGVVHQLDLEFWLPIPRSRNTKKMLLGLQIAVATVIKRRNRPRRSGC